MLRLLLIALLLIVAGGCTQRSEPGPIEFTLPARDEIAALPGRLFDHSGTIKAVEIPLGQPNRPADAEGDEFAVEVAGRPEAVFVAWLGGLCDEQVQLEYTGVDATFSVTTTTGFGGCRLAGIQRSVVVVFNEPIDAETVRVLALR